MPLRDELMALTGASAAEAQGALDAVGNNRLRSLLLLGAAIAGGYGDGDGDEGGEDSSPAPAVSDPPPVQNDPPPIDDPAGSARGGITGRGVNMGDITNTFSEPSPAPATSVSGPTPGSISVGGGETDPDTPSNNRQMSVPALARPVRIRGFEYALEPTPFGPRISVPLGARGPTTITLPSRSGDPEGARVTVRPGHAVTIGIKGQMAPRERAAASPLVGE